MIPIKIAVGALLLVVLCCGMLLLWSRYRQRRLLLRLQQMLDEAIAGTFTEHSFDETMLSALESRMADYLSASVTTAMQLQKEKDTIKELDFGYFPSDKNAHCQYFALWAAFAGTAAARGKSAMCCRFAGAG